MSGSDQNFFDVQFATNQFSGNQLLLLQILKKFIQQYEHFDSVLEGHLQQQDINAAKQDVHTIKGVSGNLGMKTLHQACKELEVDLANPITDYTLEAFSKVFKQTITVVENYSTENDVEESPTEAIQLDDKAELLAALKRNEFISDSKMQDYSQSLGFPSEKLDKLKQAIDNLDYASAIELLE